jgi:PAS domain S-box-containing protein
LDERSTHTASGKSPFESEILDAFPDGVIWTKPVYNANNEIHDFEIAYINRTASEVLFRGFIKGKRILRDRISESDKSPDDLYRELASVQRQQDDQRSSQQSVIRIPFSNGVLSLYRQHATTSEKQEKPQDAELLYKIVQNAPAGIVAYEAVRDENGTLVDFRCKLFNNEVNRLTGFSDDERRSLPLKTILQGTGVERNFDLYKNTVITGQPFSTQFYYPKTKRWLHFFGVKLGDGFISIVTDNTEKIEQQQSIQKHAQYLSSIFESSQSAINTMQAIRDREGVVIDFRYKQINKAFEKITHMSAAEVIGKTLLELFPNALETGIFDAYRQALNCDEPEHLQVYYKGQHLDAWYDLSIVKLDADTLVGTFSDISEIKRAQLALEHSRDRLNLFINSSQTGLCLFQPVIDHKGEVTDFTFDIANNSFAYLIGRTPDELTGKSIGELSPEFKTDGSFENFKHTYLTGEPTRFEVHHVDGTERWLDTTCTKMEEGILITINDITEVKRLHLQLEKSIDDLKNSNANLEAFAYAASHDLKEPIRKISFFSDFIKNDINSTLGAESKSIFDRLLGSVSRMNLLIDDLLSYSQITFQNAEFSEVDLNSVVDTVLSDLDVLIEQKHATIKRERLPVIQGHVRQLQQLFHNLVSNALKYSRPGVPPEIVITTRKISGSAQHLIEVKDNGIGFPTEDAERIFNVFQRLHGNGEIKGTGIGLAIVRKVVENHKGHIVAESQPGKGATFRLMLPAKD